METKTKPEIKEGSYYLWRTGALIRQVIRFMPTHADVYWQDWGTWDGRRIGDGVCSLTFFRRHATEEVGGVFCSIPRNYIPRDA